MKKIITIAGVVFCSWVGAAQATDVINQDNKAYSVKVQGEGKLSISKHNVGSRGSVYGLCGYSFCTFEIPGSKVTANKDARLNIRGGKFVK